jgi:hypothetical protein
MASTLLTGALPVPGFGAAAGFAAAFDDGAGGLAGAFAGADFWVAGLCAGLGAGFFIGAGLVFDFVAVLDAITVLFAAQRCGGHRRQRARNALPQRIAAGSVDRGSLSPN